MMRAPPQPARQPRGAEVPIPPMPAELMAGPEPIGYGAGGRSGAGDVAYGNRKRQPPKGSR